MKEPRTRNILQNIKEKTLTVYPLGLIDKPADFSDIMSKKYGHVACVISLSAKEAKKECVIWDDDGYPDIYIKNKKITFRAMERGLRLLEKDSKNKFKYKLIKKNYMEII